MYQKQGEKLKRAILRKEREKNNLTQGELSERLGISEIAVRSYENGSRNPSNSVVKLYVDFFNEDPRRLFPDIFLPLFDTKRISNN